MMSARASVIFGMFFIIIARFIRYRMEKLNKHAKVSKIASSRVHRILLHFQFQLCFNFAPFAPFVNLPITK